MASNRDDLAARVVTLSQLSLFSGLRADELAEVAEHCTERTYRKGETLWHAGEQGDELLVILSGELAVLSPTEEDIRIVALLGSGECLGEIALLLDEPRSATVTCSRTARVLVLAGTDFHRLMRDDSNALVAVSQALAKRVVATTRTREVSRATTTIGVVARRGVPGASLVAGATATMLSRQPHTNVLLVSLGASGPALDDLVASGAEVTRAQIERRTRGPSRLDVTMPESATSLAAGLSEMFEVLGDRYRCVIVDVPSGPVGAAESLASACDVLIEVSSGRGLPLVRGTGAARVVEVLNRAHPACGPRALNHCEPFVLPLEPSLAGLSRDAQISRLVGEPMLPAGRVIGRLARKLIGATVGIALGGGAAFGVSHIGVLEALDAAGIPVDLVAGTSMGSIIGLGYAGGLSGAGMHTIANEFATLRNSLGALDVSFSGLGFMSGRRLIRTFSSLVPVETFEELELPAQTVATDVRTGERVTIGTGRLDDAFRASSSVPVLFAPVQRDGRVLVDGAMVDPVPADVVHEMGADVVIAVNVVPQLNPKVKTAISRLYGRANQLNVLARFNGTIDAPHVVDILMNSLQVSQFELGHWKALSADVRVNVDLADFTWIDFLRSPEIIERGLAAAERAMPEIKAAFAAAQSGQMA